MSEYVAVDGRENAVRVYEDIATCCRCGSKYKGHTALKAASECFKLHRTVILLGYDWVGNQAFPETLKVFSLEGGKATYQLVKESEVGA
jgi:hypothetical protein